MTEMILKREPKTICSVCGGFVYDNVDPEKIITCGLCVQKRLIAFNQRNSPEEQERAVKAIRETGVKKTSRLVGISPKSVRNWMKDKRVPARQLEFVLKIGNSS